MLWGFSIFITLDYTSINTDLNQRFPNFLTTSCRTERVGPSSHFLPTDVPVFVFLFAPLVSAHTPILALPRNRNPSECVSPKLLSAYPLAAPCSYVTHLPRALRVSPGFLGLEGRPLSSWRFLPPVSSIPSFSSLSFSLPPQFAWPLSGNFACARVSSGTRTCQSASALFTALFNFQGQISSFCLTILDSGT